MINGTDWMVPTTFLERFGDALELLCKGNRPSIKLMTDWWTEENDNLQWFVSDYCLHWAQAIVTIEAAELLADTPTEGIDHEYR